MRLACFAGLLFGTLALACSDSDTIVALNVCTLASVDAEAIESLEVRIQGVANQAHDLQGVSVLPCGTKPAYFKRIKLPEATDKGSATIDVRALDGAGALLETGRVEVSVRPEETVAAFVEQCGADHREDGDHGQRRRRDLHGGLADADWVPPGTVARRIGSSCTSECGRRSSTSSRST